MPWPLVAAGLGALGAGIAGTIGNIGLRRREGELLDMMMNLARRYQGLSPGQAAGGIMSFEQPLSQDLINAIMRQVQAEVGLRGFADSPALFAEITAQTLGPYQLAEQQLAAQNYWNLMQLPIEALQGVRFPEAADVSGLFGSGLEWLLGGLGGGGGGGGVSDYDYGIGLGGA